MEFFRTTTLFFSDFIYLYPLLMCFVWIIGGLVFYFRHEWKNNKIPQVDNYPPFSILIPCHNEEEHIYQTIQQTLLLDYPEFEIIAIDDGSTDKTASIIKQLSAEHKQVRCLFLKTNQGKAAALTIGALVSKFDFLLAIDADALLDSRALRWMAWHFNYFPRVGAVTGNPRVLNRTTLLAKIQVGEFSSVIGLIKRSQRILGKILTVSGVIAAFRKSALHSVGYWSTNMATEDIDITWKLERHFWDVRYEPRALCWIYVPETLRGFWRQRVRWALGGVEVLKKNFPIWSDYRQRRLWPLYLEYCVSIIWAYSFWIFTIFAIISILFNISFHFKPMLLIPPLWAGSILTLACLTQFVVSLFMDRTYERNMIKYLFWIIWYPFIYWMIMSITTVVAVPKSFVTKQSRSVVWKKSDRGYIGK